MGDARLLNTVIRPGWAMLASSGVGVIGVRVARVSKGRPYLEDVPWSLVRHV